MQDENFSFETYRKTISVIDHILFQIFDQRFLVKICVALFFLLFDLFFDLFIFILNKI